MQLKTGNNQFSVAPTLLYKNEQFLALDIVQTLAYLTQNFWCPWLYLEAKCGKVNILGFIWTLSLTLLRLHLWNLNYPKLCSFWRLLTLIFNFRLDLDEALPFSLENAIYYQSPRDLIRNFSPTVCINNQHFFGPKPCQPIISLTALRDLGQVKEGQKLYFSNWCVNCLM